jgi:hypothetical protein
MPEDRRREARVSSRIFFSLIALASFAFGAAAHATAGPPLVTDDPGTPGANSWEINGAFTSESSSSDKHVELPILDVNYGVGERIQLKYEVPDVISQNDETRNTGLDRSQAGVKWRFQEKEGTGIALSTYPQFTFKSPVADGARNADSATTQDFFLPIEAEESFGKWDFNQEAGYRWLEGKRSQVACGLALTFNWKETVAFLGEVHVDAADNFSGSQMLANAGTILGLNKYSSLLFSAGRTFSQFGDDPNHTLLYAALQLHI